MRVEPKSLVRKLTPTATRHLEAAVGRAATGGFHEIAVEHLLAALLAGEEGDVARMLHEAGADRLRLLGRVERALERMATGQSGRPVISERVFRWIEDAWLWASVEAGATRLRSGHLFLQLLARPERYLGDTFPELTEIDVSAVQGSLEDVLSASPEAGEVELERGAGPVGDGAMPAAAAGQGEALRRFTTDFTERARDGKIDPIFGRHREIRQLVDILTRRRKNNPIIVGEPGVGKTALVEGLARAIVQGEVPAALRDVRLLGLDLGLLQAGAGVRGEFENRLKAVIGEVKTSAKPVVLFIDEAHTLVGGHGGGGDAANLLKPALARGELRTIAATTWSEFKKYFEKDAALERRFQPVKVEEPGEDEAILMLRGLRPAYEAAHGVTIRDEAVVEAVRLSRRYITGRQLPDKAVDLLDTASARVKVALAAKPEELVALEEEVSGLEREHAALARDVKEGQREDGGALAAIEERLAAACERKAALASRLETERAAVEKLRQVRAAVNGAVASGAQADRSAVETAAPGSAAAGGAETDRSVAEAGRAATGGADAGEAEEEAAPVGDVSAGTVETSRSAAACSTEGDRSAVEAAAAELARVRGEEPLVHAEVDAQAVAQVVAGWTGIPVGKMRSDRLQAVLELEAKLSERVRGQDEAVKAVADVLRVSHAGIRNPGAPVGVLLFVGPSGVGKTEMAIALADALYGGERFMTTLSMSEFQEKHTVSRLIGSPPGYVGFGEGGLLTEAVRQRPYSVVLLDECEKADLEVMNLFYQVFDKGVLTDGEGREVDFKNTLIVLTSNLGSAQVMAMHEGDARPCAEEVATNIRPTLSRHFKPALLARMSVVPFAPLPAEVLREIVEMKLAALGRRLRETHGIEGRFSPELVEALAGRCGEPETGARNVDHVLRGSLMPALSRALLEKLSAGEEVTRAEVGVADGGGFSIELTAGEGAGP